MTVSQLKQLHQNAWFMNTHEVARFLTKYGKYSTSGEKSLTNYGIRIACTELHEMFKGEMITVNGNQVDLYRQMQCEVTSFIPWTAVKFPQGN